MATTVREDGKVREVLDVRPADKLMIALLVDDSEVSRRSFLHLRDGLAALLERPARQAEIAPNHHRRTSDGGHARHEGHRKTAQEADQPDFSAIGVRGVSARRDLRGLPRPAKREGDRPIILALTVEGVELQQRLLPARARGS